MPRFYWTVPYVAIEDSLLSTAYYVGTALILVYFCASMVTEHTYMETRPVVGLARPQLRKLTIDERMASQPPPYCDKVGCRLWDADETAMVVRLIYACILRLIRLTARG